MCGAVSSGILTSAPGLVLLRGSGPPGVVAVVSAEIGEDGRPVAVCWWNCRVVRCAELGYLAKWASRSVAVGWAIRTMRVDELVRFREEMEASAR